MARLRCGAARLLCFWPQLLSRCTAGSDSAGRGWRRLSMPRLLLRGWQWLGWWRWVGWRRGRRGSAAAHLLLGCCCRSVAAARPLLLRCCCSAVASWRRLGWPAAMLAAWPGMAHRRGRDRYTDAASVGATTAHLPCYSVSMLPCAIGRCDANESAAVGRSIGAAGPVQSRSRGLAPPALR